MNILVHTQSLENYGGHDWNGKGECPQYWKFKGGMSILVCGVKSDRHAVAVVLSNSSTNSDHYMEFPSSWEEVGADFVPIIGRENCTYEAYKSGRYVHRIWDEKGQELEEVPKE